MRVNQKESFQNEAGNTEIPRQKTKIIDYSYHVFLLDSWFFLRGAVERRFLSKTPAGPETAQLGSPTSPLPPTHLCDLPSVRAPNVWSDRFSVKSVVLVFQNKKSNICSRDEVFLWFFQSLHCLRMANLPSLDLLNDNARLKEMHLMPLQCIRPSLSKMLEPQNDCH